MASPPVPPALDHLISRTFAFYPPIVNVESNEWLYRKATWSEILVVNCKSGAEIWLSRRYVGEVSRVDEPILIVGLNRELEYKGGTIFPCQRRVIQMPGAASVSQSPSTPDAERGKSARIVGIRLESADKRILKMIGGAMAVMAAAILLYAAAISFNRLAGLRQKTVAFATKDQQYLELTARDDYFGVVQKLGQPASDHWQSDSNTLQLRALAYPDRNYTVILMGTDRRTALYIGTVDDRWNPVHSVEFHSGGSTASLLRNLKKF